MASEYDDSGYQVAHDIHVLHAVTGDLLHTWYCDPNGHRFIEASYKEIKFLAQALTALCASINSASTAPSKPLYQDLHTVMPF